jgi:hypothetical protein
MTEKTESPPVRHRTRPTTGQSLESVVVKQYLVDFVPQTDQQDAMLKALPMRVTRTEDNPEINGEWFIDIRTKAVRWLEQYDAETHAIIQSRKEGSDFVRAAIISINQAIPIIWPNDGPEG